MSWDKNSQPLRRRILREHQLTGTPVAVIMRRLMAKGDALEVKQNTQVLTAVQLTMTNIKLTSIQFEMLKELGKKNRPSPLKPDLMAGKLIEQSYNSSK